VNLDDANELIRERRDKLAALRAAGIDPFGGRFPVTHWARPLADRLTNAGEEELRGFGPVSLAGRIVALRHHGKSCFGHLMDYTGRIQLYARADQLGDDYARFTDLDRGDFVGVTGEMFRTRTGELTVAVKAFSFLAKSLRPLPRNGTASAMSRHATGSGTSTSSSTRRCGRSSCSVPGSWRRSGSSSTRAASSRSRRR